MEITIDMAGKSAVQDEPIEMVERKGLGHPDYICDAAMDRVSVALSREYLKKCGRVLHHNIDKGLLVAGEAEKGFGKGRIIKPMEFIVGDRAVFKAGKKSIPASAIAEKTVKEWFRENLKGIDPDKHLNIRSVLKPGSAELQDIFERKGRVIGANDTSAAVGYAPLTMTEKAVYETERFMNSPAFKFRFPETGTDVKVMGFRKNKGLDLTISCPLLCSHIKSEKEYFFRKESVASAILEFISSSFGFSQINLNFNALDRPGHGVNGVYLSVLGTSAEDADSGQVGRGNRVNGVISLMRPMGTEAAAGKNPISHVGKIYSVLSHMMAREIYERTEGVKEAYVWLLSQIGAPIDEPKTVYVRITPDAKAKGKAMRRGVSLVIDELLSGMGRFTSELAIGEHPVC